MSKVLISAAVLFFLCPVPGFCREDGKGFVLKRHEISVSGSFFQHMYMDNPQLNRDNTAFMTDDYLMSMAGVSENEKERMTGSWRIAYAYNISKVFAIEAGFDYEGYRNVFFNSETSVRTKAFHGDIYGLMATLRINWLNRSLVRVYSSAGGGVSVMVSGANYSKSGGPAVKYSNSVIGDWEVVPVGMTIGKGIFGLVELGIGTVFVGGRFGIGYRF